MVLTSMGYLIGSRVFGNWDCLQPYTNAAMFLAVICIGIQVAACLHVSAILLCLFRRHASAEDEVCVPMNVYTILVGGVATMLGVLGAFVFWHGDKPGFKSAAETSCVPAICFVVAGPALMAVSLLVGEISFMRP